VSKVTRYFYDTEFNDDGSTIDLVSIGIVSDDGREYYAVSSEFDVHPDVKSRSQIAAEVRDFLLAAGPPQIWAWFAAFDHVAYSQLFGKMIDIPDGLPWFTCDLKQEHVRLGSPELPAQRDGEHHALADARYNKVVFDFLCAHEARNANW
jgi:hypothetical protein